MAIYLMEALLRLHCEMAVDYLQVNKKEGRSSE